MNEADFEKDLQRLLRPAPPSAALHSRIRRELRAPDATARNSVEPPASAGAPGLVRRLLRDFGWACAGAAAALTALAFVPTRQAPVNPPRASAPPAAQAAAFEHDATSNELLKEEDSDQLVETDDGPAREVHHNYRERHEWSNPRTGARVVLEVPREDVYLLPVSLQ